MHTFYNHLQFSFQLVICKLADTGNGNGKQKNIYIIPNNNILIIPNETEYHVNTDLTRSLLIKVH